MKAIKDVLSSLFGVGGISMMRFLTFFVVVDIMLVWTISCAKAGFAMQDFPTGVAGVFLAVVMGKVGQRFAENGGEHKKEGED